MRITRIEVHPVQSPGRTLVVVLVHTDSGLIGVGEAGLQRRWRAIQGAVEHLGLFLVGRDPMQIERLWQEMFRGGFYPGDRLIGSALSAIDIALWDIKGQALGVPVYELLGGRCRDRVEAFFQPGYLSAQIEHPTQPGGEPRSAGERMSPEQAVALARQHLDRGLRYFRIGPRADGGVFHARQAIDEAVAILRAVRQAVGNHLELMIDLHTRLNPAEALWFCNQVEPLGVYVVEDPIRSEHPAGYRHIRRHTRVPLAAGEQWANKWEFRTVIEEELVDFVRVDLCIAGGLTEGRKIAAMAETHYIQLLLHNPLGPVCTAASLHLDLACDNAGPQEVLWPPQEMLPGVFTCDFCLEDGHLTVPTGPGLGVRFDPEAARQFPADMTEPPRWQHPDGGYTNY